MRRYKTYINGEWFEGASGIVLRSVDPSNNKELGEIVQNSKEDVEYVIESASRSFYKTREWRDLDVQQRSDKLLKIADMIESEIDEIAKTESMDNASPCVKRRQMLTMLCIVSVIMQGLSVHQAVKLTM